MERPFPIKGWTLPGVMGAGAGQIMLKGAGALPTEPVVLAGCGPLLYLLAWQYLRAGVAIKALVDTTPQSAYVRALREAAGALKGWRDLAKGMKLLASIKRHGVKVYSGATDLAIVGGPCGPRHSIQTSRAAHVRRVFSGVTASRGGPECATQPLDGRRALLEPRATLLVAAYR